MRSKLLSLLPDPAVDALRRVRALLRDPHAQPCYSQEGEDMVLRRIFNDVQAGFFVDVGAHHPWRFSNTQLFSKLGWRGMNIEPNPDARRLFLKHRPRDINLQLGVAETPGTLVYHFFDEPALNTFDSALVADRLAKTKYRVLRTERIPVHRLDDILFRNLPPGQRIDFMSIDVEGLDLDVVRSNNWEKYRPSVVLAEALDTSLQDTMSGALARFMQERGYVLFAKTFNTLFFRDGRST